MTRVLAALLIVFLSGAADRVASAAAESPQEIYNTRVRFRDPTGRNRYNKDRQKLHDAIIQKMLSGGVSSEHPEILFLAGSIGSGKSTILNSLESSGAVKADKYVHIDLDHLQTLIPETKEFLKLDFQKGASYTFGEARDLVEELFEAAVNQRKNIVFDSLLSGSFHKLSTI